MGNIIQELNAIKKMKNLEQLHLVDGNDDIISLKPLYHLKKLKLILISSTTETKLPQKEVDYFGGKLEFD